jgi:hypothetical protein
MLETLNGQGDEPTRGAQLFEGAPAILQTCRSLWDTLMVTIEFEFMREEDA